MRLLTQNQQHSFWENYSKLSLDLIGKYFHVIGGRLEVFSIVKNFIHSHFQKVESEIGLLNSHDSKVDFKWFPLSWQISVSYWTFFYSYQRAEIVGFKVYSHRVHWHLNCNWEIAYFHSCCWQGWNYWRFNDWFWHFMVNLYLRLPV